MRPQQTHFVLCFLAAASLPHIANGRAPAPNVDFNRDVRPILSQHCFKCHGFDPQARRSKLRLDRREAITAELPSGYTPVVAGDPQASELIRRIAATDPADRMPPADVAEPLSSDEIATLTAWIEEGAPWAEHWRLVPPHKTALPPVVDPRWSRQPIDRFILSRLEAERIVPSPEADRATLLRRLTLDLTGLPPTPGEIDAFLADDCRTPANGWSTGSSPVRITANGWPGDGSTSPATPIRAATRTTISARCGPIATGSWRRSMQTCRSTHLLWNSLPVICSPNRPLSNSSRAVFIATRPISTRVAAIPNSTGSSGSRTESTRRAQSGWG